MKAYIFRCDNNHLYLTVEKPTVFGNRVYVKRKIKTDNMVISSEYVNQLGLDHVIQKNEIVEVEITLAK